MGRPSAHKYGMFFPAYICPYHFCYIKYLYRIHETKRNTYTCAHANAYTNNSMLQVGILFIQTCTQSRTHKRKTNTLKHTCTYAMLRTHKKRARAYTICRKLTHK